MVLKSDIKDASALKVSVGPRAGVSKLTFQALGTECSIQFVADTETQANSFGQAVVDWVGKFEARYSRFRDDSLISRINAAAGRDWVEIDEEMELLLQLCDQLYMTTSGIFDPTALPLIRLWYRSLGMPVPEIPSDSAVRDAMGTSGLAPGGKGCGEDQVARRGDGH